jgi:hypothetical protein
MGTWEWDSSFAYLTQIVYTCGPFGQFKAPGDQIIAECAWNKTWIPSVIDICQGKNIFEQVKP